MELEQTDEMTTTSIKRNDLLRLENLKEHPNVPNWEIIKRLLDLWNRYKDVVEQAR